jgi:hypothetical protein
MPCATGSSSRKREIRTRSESDLGRYRAVYRGVCVLTMSNRFRILPLVLCAVLVPAVAAPAPAAAKAGPQSGVSTKQSRLGRGFGGRGFGRRPAIRTRPRTGVRRPVRPFGRRSFARRFFGGVLKALGIAYLFHLMFGWGAGGSPFGLLLLAAIVLFLVTRRRRRRVAYYY